MDTTIVSIPIVVALNVHAWLSILYMYIYLSFFQFKYPRHAPFWFIFTIGR